MGELEFRGTSFIAEEEQVRGIVHYYLFLEATSLGGVVLHVLVCEVAVY